MSQYAWENAPQETQQQLKRFTGALQDALAGILKGVYLHGSLAMGCFNPRRSDLDLLVVTSASLDLSTKWGIATLLLAESGRPHPLEISFLPHDFLFPWRYPTPYDFHFSEDWRMRMESALHTGAWRGWNDEIPVDIDLAAHLTITRKCGVSLYSEPAGVTLPVVPAGDYLASILEDVRDSLEGRIKDPVYSILNICRVAAFKQDGLICSKKDGGLWGLQALPEETHAVIRQALEIYAGDGNSQDFDPRELAKFTGLMKPLLLD